MSLTQLMSAAGLTFYPIVALVLFLGVFALVMVRTFSRGQRGAMRDHAAIPLRDETADMAVDERANGRGGEA